MPNQITLQAFLDALNKQEARKNVKLNVEAELNASNQYDLKIRSIEVSKEVLKELNIVPKATKGKEDIVKKPTMKELMIQGFDNINKQLETVNKRLDGLEVASTKLSIEVGRIDERLEKIEKLPIIQKALDEQNSKDRTR